ncbi:MAG: hypothetical protein ACRELD_12250, partial [Longimicrobiales bacterium]
MVCCRALLCLLSLATPALAQSPLARADSLARSGHATAARAHVADWWRANGAAASPERPQALYLRAILQRRFSDAEPDLLALVLGYPTTPQAPDALLRLGQGLLAAGDTSRADAYLRRLAIDYPGAAAGDVARRALAPRVARPTP